MAEARDKDEMTQALASMVEKAQDELGPEEAVNLSQVMKALCLDLTDIGSRYFVVFDEEGGTSFSTEEPNATPMLTITTTSVVFHNMAIGESNPAMEFALRKVKMSGVPLTRLTKVGGHLVDTLFSCYKASVQ